MKHMKAKMISYLKAHPQANFKTLLHDTTNGYNHTYSDILKGTPASLNSNFYDPILRERLYGKHPPLQPFENWYKDQLKLQKRSFTPRTARLRNYNDFRVNDLVFVQYDGLTKVQKRHWSQRTERTLYRIARVNTIGKLILYLCTKILHYIPCLFFKRQLHSWNSQKDGNHIFREKISVA